MDKTAFTRLFAGITSVNFSVTYWDGTTTQYGAEPPAFAIVFKKQPSILDLSGDPTIYLGEAYMRGDIELEGDCAAMALAVEDLENYAGSSPNNTATSKLLLGIASVARTLKRQKGNIAAHYDLGNDFFSLWLDPSTSSYSCAYFRSPADTLDTAQEQKAELVLKKLHLRPGMRLLDIGCGWGWLALRAARDYGVRVLALTLSEEQFAATRQRFADNGVNGMAEVRLGNYLELEGNGRFDRVVSVGMFEHVGKAHHTQYFEKVRDLLKQGGLSLLHTLTKFKPSENNAWIQKYIFPGGYIPAPSEIVSQLPQCGFHLLNVENLRRHYVRTLELWHDNFSCQDVLDRVRARFGEAFCRMWSLYLRMAGASLAAGVLDVHQFVFTKGINDDLPMTMEDVYGSGMP